MAKIIYFLEQTIKWIAILAFTVMVISAFLQVFSRYVINVSFSWTDELARYMFIWGTMLGGCIVHRQKGHVMVDIILSRFPTQMQNVINIIIDFLSLCVLVVLFVQGINLLPIGRMQITPALGIRMSWVMLSLPVAAFFMALTTLEHLHADFKKFLPKSAEKAISKEGQ